MSCGPTGAAGRALPPSEEAAGRSLAAALWAKCNLLVTLVCPGPGGVLGVLLGSPSPPRPLVQGAYASCTGDLRRAVSCLVASLARAPQRSGSAKERAVGGNFFPYTPAGLGQNLTSMESSEIPPLVLTPTPPPHNKLCKALPNQPYHAD